MVHKRYCGSGNKIRENNYEPDNTLKKWTEYEYDASGKTIQQKKCLADGSVEEWKKYDFDNLESVTTVDIYYEGNINSPVSENETFYRYENIYKCVE